MDTELAQAEPAAVIASEHTRYHQRGRHRLGYGGCPGDARHVHIAHYNKEQIEQHVEYACRSQIVHRLFKRKTNEELVKCRLVIIKYQIRAILISLEFLYFNAVFNFTDKVNRWAENNSDNLVSELQPPLLFLFFSIHRTPL